MDRHSPCLNNSFDAVAATYDATFTATRLGRWLRAAVWERLSATFRPGDYVLELGCGTGTDAVWLAKQGVRIMATDASPSMLEIARHKVAAAGMVEQVSFQHLDLACLETPELKQYPAFDGVLSNFGALNCLPDRRPVAEALAHWVRPGGCVVLVVMGPFCPWEIVWHLLHGQVRTAFRRLRAGLTAQVGHSKAVRVWYPSPRRLRIEFTQHFRHLETTGVGVLLPPSYLNHLVERWPRFFQTLAAWDDRLGVFPGTWLNDHYLSIYERR